MKNRAVHNSARRRTLRARALGLIVAVAVMAPVAAFAAPGSAGALTVSPEGGSCPATPEDLVAAAQFDWNLGIWVQAVQKMPQHPLVANEIVRNKRSLYGSARAVGATRYYDNGYFGAGVDVALIDTGVAPVDGLNSGNVVHGPDLSFETVVPELRYNDAYGHGTHMASIIAGRDDANSQRTSAHAPYSYDDPTKFTGIAPGARVVSLKVGDAQGNVDVTQVIAAIDWVTQHANDPKSATNPTGFNIRVINLSYGIDSSEFDTFKSNALSKAVQAAWDAGIVVVAATGNGGKVKGRPVSSPAFNTNIIAVGAYDPQTGDVPDFNQVATKGRAPDLVAPGRSVLGLHVPGSNASESVIEACNEAIAAGEEWNSPVLGPNGRFVRGSGTSQAAAYVSGAVALILSKNPEMTPDQVKYLLRSTASGQLGYGVNSNGQGRLDLDRAFDRVIAKTYKQNQEKIVGGASLDAARAYEFLWDGETTQMAETFVGACDPNSANYKFFVAYGLDPSPYCVEQPVLLRGDVDIFGNKVDVPGLQAAEAARKAWTRNADGTEQWFSGGFIIGHGLSTDPVVGPAWSMPDWTTHEATAGLFSTKRFRDDGFSTKRFRDSDFLDGYWS